jgi:hypothetical protein
MSLMLRVPILAFPFAAPIVHVVHGDGTGAAGSFLLHLTAPIAGAVIGYKIEMRGQCNSDMCGLGGLLLGGLAGAATATIIDAVFLAHVERPLPPYARRPPAIPTLVIARGGLMLGVGGPL